MLTVLAADLTQPHSAVTLAGATLREDEEAKRKIFQNFFSFITA